jgi:hypothetical protein
MTRILIVALLAWLAGSPVSLGQEPKTGEVEQVQPADEDKATESLPEVDVWAEEAEQESDVFVPTESISADSSIAFPSDI